MVFFPSEKDVCHQNVEAQASEQPPEPHDYWERLLSICEESDAINICISAQQSDVDRARSHLG